MSSGIEMGEYATYRVNEGIYALRRDGLCELKHENNAKLHLWERCAPSPGQEGRLFGVRSLAMVGVGVGHGEQMVVVRKKDGSRERTADFGRSMTSAANRRVLNRGRGGKGDNGDVT